jgi:hypothetical protein
VGLFSNVAFKFNLRHYAPEKNRKRKRACGKQPCQRYTAADTQAAGEKERALAKRPCRKDTPEGTQVAGEQERAAPPDEAEAEAEPEQVEEQAKDAANFKVWPPSIHGKPLRGSAKACGLRGSAP